MVEVTESDVREARRESVVSRRESVISGETDEQVWNKLQHDTLNHKKRIKDLIELAQESRQRIDVLLGRRSTTKLDFDDSVTPLPSVNRASFDHDSDDRNSRRGSRDSSDSNRYSDRDYSYGQNEWDRNRDIDRDLSDSERRGSRRQTKDGDLKRQETSEHIVTRTNNQGHVDVGGVTITTSKLDQNGNSSGSPSIKRQQKMVESVATVNISPKVTKKPFKFGMISLQVKLDD